MGVNLSTNVELSASPGPSPQAACALELHHDCVDSLPEVASEAYQKFKSNFSIDGQPHHYMHRCDGFDVIEVLGTAHFYLYDGQIESIQLRGVREVEVERLITGLVLAYWLATRGVFCLHASAVVVDDAAAAFVANSTGGKSTLAASFVQDGHGLLTDDMLAVIPRHQKVVAYPGYSKMRVWPNTARYFVGDTSRLVKVHPKLDKVYVNVGDHFGTFCTEPSELKAIYVPVRGESDDLGEDVSIRDLKGGEAFLEVARHTLLSKTFIPMGIAKRHALVMGEVLKHVRVKVLLYRSGLSNLGAVKEAVYDDLACLA
jgi:hypothetical protein